MSNAVDTSQSPKTERKETGEQTVALNEVKAGGIF